MVHNENLLLQYKLQYLYNQEIFVLKKMSQLLDNLSFKKIINKYLTVKLRSSEG